MRDSRFANIACALIDYLKRLIQQAKSHAGFKRYFVNTSWMLGEQFLRMLSGLLVGIWVARYLGPEQFGIFSYAIAFVSIFGTVAKLGLDGIVVRDLVNDPQKRDIYLGTAFWLKFVGALTTLAIIAIAILLIDNSHATNLYIFIIAGGIIFQSFEVIDFYFQSKVLSKFVSLCKISQLLVSSLLKIYFVLMGADLFWFVLVSLIDQITLASTLYIAYRYQKISHFYRHFDWITAKNLLENSWPLIFSGLVVMIYMRIDQIMIKQMLGEKEVGIYSAAVKLSEFWYFIPLLITNSIFPAIVAAKKVSEPLYYKRLQLFFSFMVWAAIAIALPVTFLSNSLVNLVYGSAYIQAGQVLAIHIWTGIFVFLGVASSSWFTSENLQKLIFYRTFAGAVINIALNLLLIPVYGVVGSAIATLITQLMSGTIFDVLSRNTRKLFFMKLNTLNIFRVLAVNSR